jgi:hypothetical protein
LQLGSIDALQGEAGGALSSSQARCGKRKQQCERDTQSGQNGRSILDSRTCPCTSAG